MTDTSSLHGIGLREAIYAVARGVCHESTARVRPISDARRGEPARAVPAVRDTSPDRLQVGPAPGGGGGGGGAPPGPPLPPPAGRGGGPGGEFWGWRRGTRPGG